VPYKVQAPCRVHGRETLFKNQFLMIWQYRWAAVVIVRRSSLSEYSSHRIRTCFPRGSLRSAY